MPDRTGPAERGRRNASAIDGLADGRARDASSADNGGLAASEGTINASRAPRARDTMCFMATVQRWERRSFVCRSGVVRARTAYPHR